ncbi:hypothetical protein Trihar35433_10092 [Trichoderma harzianum]|nr:hypothetical protein Trihar35433_10092 [Trichoderma harzianum]
MAAPNAAEHAPKRRKTRQDSGSVTIGGKTISVAGYLTSSRPKQVEANSSPKSTPQAPSQEQPSNVISQSQQSTKKPSFEGSGTNNKFRNPRGVKDHPLLKARRELPIWQHQDEIRTVVKRLGTDVIVIVGETGSGKSTQVPQFLYQESWCKRHKVKLPGREEDGYVGGMIAITQPRRVAATTLAHRVSTEAGTPLGKGRPDGLVGYSVRFDHQVPRGARIKFLTEGTLLQELLRDPYLRQYSAVVIDEIHERSLDVDLLAGFLKQILFGDKTQRGGVPLKVIIMSATAEVGVIQDFFGNAAIPGKEKASNVELLRIKGRQFPVTILYEPRPVADLQDALLKKIFKIHVEEPLPGDILAFLNGQEDIESAQRLIEEYATSLASNVPKIIAVPLYGQLSIEAQRVAFLPAKSPLTRKVVLATNIAETSVTVPGVRYVVDCGKAKVKQYRPRLGMESLLAKPISKSSAVQRAGRAGREGPGKCFRLYTEDAFDSLEDSDLPEILRNDVLGAVLTMKARGIQDVLSFPLIDAPEPAAIEMALLHLHFLGALADDGTITSAGEMMARFPLSAPLGAVLLAASGPEFDCVLEVIDAISCLTSGDDIFMHVQSEEAAEEVESYRKDIQRREGDIITYLTTMQMYTAENSDRMEWCKKRKINIRNMKQALNIRRQLRGMCLKEKLLSEMPAPDPQPFTPLSPEKAESVIKCFLRGFAMRTAMLAPDGSFVTVHGKHVVAIHPSSVMHGQKKEAIMFLEHVYTNKNYAKKVSAIQAAWIAEALGR